MISFTGFKFTFEEDDVMVIPTVIREDVTAIIEKFKAMGLVTED